MIVGFSKYGTGGGKGPTEYVTDKKREGREECEPVTVRGDAEQTRNLIDSLDFKWKYTSGVLSFAPDEIITPEMESEIIDRFESLAFAGLDHDQYNILWVRHTHAGHHELHFITPRVELETGKSLNIKPPGDLAREHFDDFRSEVNAKYGLADPTDPDRERNISVPNHVLKKAAEALRNGEKAPDNMWELIDKALTQRALEGLIRSREDVLSSIKELGLKTTRQGKNYITVSDPNSTDRWRLKGGLYAKDFEFRATIKKENISGKRDYSKPDKATAKRYEERVERHISARAKYHESRYHKAKKSPKLDIHNTQDILAISDRSDSLNRYLFRELEHDVIFNQRDIKRTPNLNSSRERRGKNKVLQLWGKEVREDRHIGGNLQRRIQNTRGVLNDRTRESLIKSIEDLRNSIQRATKNSKERSNELNQDVQRYSSRKQTFGLRSNDFKETSNRLERSIINIKQSFQKVIKERNRSQQLSRFGLSF